MLCRTLPRILATSLLVTFSSTMVVMPVQAKKPVKPSPKSSSKQTVPPWENPRAQELVSAGKMPPFFNPDDLAMLPVISAPSAILVDAESGQVLFAKNADEQRPIASTTKIMTALLFIEHTKPTDIITCTDPNITKIEESSLHIKPWEKFTAENLLYGFLLRSGNDAGVVIAEHVAGSIPAFADLMNQRAEEIGCTNTHFVNPHGLTTDGHYSSARDLSLIAREAMENPRFREAVRIPERTIERSINKGDSHIVSRMKKRFHDKFPGADGIKTGNTHAAGYCYVGSATRDGHRLISVVLGARGGSSIDDTVALQGWGFRRFQPVTLTKQGETVGRATVSGGALGTVSAVATKDLKAVTDRLMPATESIKTAFIPSSTVFPAPIVAGTKLGKWVGTVGDKVVTAVPVVAGQDVGVAPLRAAMDNTSNWFEKGFHNPVVMGMSGAALCLVLWRTYARTTTKNTGSRRNRVASSR